MDPERLRDDTTVTPLAAGAQLGPYRIEASLGAGGMGEVYRATDTRLGRPVAVKITDPKFIARFEREARAISALNHPHICTLYDVGPNYLVMELVEGETLSARLRRGALAAELVLRYGAQMADALSAAHTRGITHRDLKPGNIMVTKAGVKVLDFGLAKLEWDETLTAANAVMGTPSYMAPEQREGKQCDARTDIYALGLVLYEMATGRRAAVSELQPLQPPVLDHIVKTCLAKEPEDRWQSARDIKLAMGQSSSFVPIGRPAGQPYRAATVALAGALIAVSAIAYRATRPPPLRPLMSLNVDLADDTPLARATNEGMLDLSPDGSRLALTLRGADGKLRLYTRLLNQSQVTPLAGTENASYPFFSPDGKWIGFFVDGKLKKISVEGGAAVMLCDAPNLRGASWGDDGNIIAALNSIGVLSRVPQTGGTPVPVTRLTPGELTHRWPQVLPGSQAVVFTASTQPGIYDDANIDVVSLRTGERKTLQRGGYSTRYLATSVKTGHLIYVHQGTLFATPFDPHRLALSGAPAPILQDVGGNAETGGDFAFAQNGTFVYLAGKAHLGSTSISWLDDAGNTQPLYAPPGFPVTPRFSPDGKRLAFTLNSGQGENIWVKDLDRDTPLRLSFFAGLNRGPVWTPDGKNIVFQSTNPAAPGIYWIRSDGAGEARRLTDGPGQSPFSISPDGKRLAFAQVGDGGSLGIFTAPIENDPGRGALGVRLGKAELFLGTPFFEGYPAFSPDGRWLAYQSNESGTNEIYVRPFPGPGGRWQVSTGGGLFPLWSRDGRELLFQTLDRRVMAVRYTAKGDSFIPGKPRVWAETHLLNLGNLGTYDLAPDGKRLAVILAADDGSGQKPPTHLTFLVNFFDEVRRKAPLSNK